MSRQTLAREWTDDETVRAACIVRVVAQAHGGIVSALSVARAIGLPYWEPERARSLRQVYDVMPLAVLLSVEAYPGQVILAERQPTGTLYRLTDEPPVAEAVVIARAQRAHTMLRRLRAEVEPLRGSTDLAAVLLVTMADSALASMPSHAIDAIIARAVAS